MNKNQKDLAMYFLGGTITIGFFAILGILALVEMPATNEKMLYMVVGALVSQFTQVVSYFYGSSKGSQDKDEKIQ